MTATGSEANVCAVICSADVSFSCGKWGRRLPSAEMARNRLPGAATTHSETRPASTCPTDSPANTIAFPLKRTALPCRHQTPLRANARVSTGPNSARGQTASSAFAYRRQHTTCFPDASTKKDQLTQRQSRSRHRRDAHARVAAHDPEKPYRHRWWHRRVGAGWASQQAQG